MGYTLGYLKYARGKERIQAPLLLPTTAHPGVGLTQPHTQAPWREGHAPCTYIHKGNSNHSLDSCIQPLANLLVRKLIK